MIFQIFIDVFPASFVMKLGYLSSVLQLHQFAILSSYPNVWRLGVSRVWLPEWNKKVKDIGQMASGLVAIGNDDVLLPGLNPVSFFWG